jgi:hypothetical protein
MVYLRYILSLKFIYVQINISDKQCRTEIGRIQKNFSIGDARPRAGRDVCMSTGPYGGSEYRTLVISHQDKPSEYGMWRKESDLVEDNWSKFRVDGGWCQARKIGTATKKFTCSCQDSIRSPLCSIRLAPPRDRLLCNQIDPKHIIDNLLRPFVSLVVIY